MSVLERTVRGMLETWPEQFSGRYYTSSSFDAVGLHPMRLVGIRQGFKKVGQETWVSGRHELELNLLRIWMTGPKQCFVTEVVPGCGVEWRGRGQGLYLAD